MATQPICPSCGFQHEPRPCPDRDMPGHVAPPVVRYEPGPVYCSWVQKYLAEATSREAEFCGLAAQWHYKPDADDFRALAAIHAEVAAIWQRHVDALEGRAK
jgi:hypothetical protein